jgi:hypothetical protein
MHKSCSNPYKASHSRNKKAQQAYHSVPKASTANAVKPSAARLKRIVKEAVDAAREDEAVLLVFDAGSAAGFVGAVAFENSGALVAAVDAEIELEVALT